MAQIKICVLADPFQDSNATIFITAIRQYYGEQCKGLKYVIETPNNHAKEEETFLKAVKFQDISETALGRSLDCDYRLMFS